MQNKEAVTERVAELVAELERNLADSNSKVAQYREDRNIRRKRNHADAERIAKLEGALEQVRELTGGEFRYSPGTLFDLATAALSHTQEQSK